MVSDVSGDAGIFVETSDKEESSNSEEYDNIIDSQKALLPKDEDEPLEGKRSRNHSGKNRHSSGESNIFHNLVIPSAAVKMPCEESIVAEDISNLRKYLAVAVLFLINLLNYMDRFTIAGVLLQIQQYFDIKNASIGLLQTVFIISYMIVAPLFGYLGDRYNRKIVMLAGMFIWSGATLVASFVNDKSHFPIFVVLRGLVGIGEASYSTIAPTLIADLFVKSKRTRMLSIFFFAIPVGSGLGYVVGSAAAKALGSWHWALRVTPGLGLITMMLMIVVIPNPKRGGSEASADVVAEKGLDKNENSYLDDLKYVFKNRSFMSISIGFTFMAFVVGSLTIWGPVFVAYSQIVIGKLTPCVDEGCEYANVSFIFGLITCVAGFLGVWIGAESAKKWKERGNKAADAHVCAIALISAAPFMFAGFQLAIVNLAAAWTFIFLADLCLCFTWTLVGDMTLYVTMPSRRSTAQAVQILTMHLFGDAGSPYLLGLMSDALTAGMPDTYYSKFRGLQISIYTTLFAAVLGGGGFLVASIFLAYDKKKVDDYLAGKSKSNTNSTTPLSQSDDMVKMIPVNGIEHPNLIISDDGGCGDFYTVKDKLMIDEYRTNRYKNGLSGISPKSVENLLNSKESDL